MDEAGASQAATGAAGAVRPDAAQRALFNVAPGGVFAIAPDGKLHQLSLLKGFDFLTAPAVFLPANARATGLIGVDNYIYAATVGRCGGVPDGIWTTDTSNPGKSVTAWKPEGVTLAGTVGPAFGTDGRIYVATGDGGSANGSYSASVVSLEPKTLSVKDSFSAGKSGFVTSPVVIRYKGRDLVAALNGDGKLYLLDGASPGGKDHKTALSVSAKFASFSGGYTPGALASWQSADGATWILVPVAGPLAADAKFPAANGPVTKGAIVAFKIVDVNGAPSLAAGWVSRDMTSPLPPMVINGVVFAVGSGLYYGAESSLTAAQRRQRSAPAVLYALDGVSGAELWNSGTILSTPSYSGGISSVFSTVFMTTTDNTLWAFGFPQDKM